MKEIKIIQKYYEGLIEKGVQLSDADILHLASCMRILGNSKKKDQKELPDYYEKVWKGNTFWG